MRSYLVRIDTDGAHTRLCARIESSMCIECVIWHQEWVEKNRPSWKSLIFCLLFTIQCVLKSMTSSSHSPPRRSHFGADAVHLHRKWSPQNWVQSNRMKYEFGPLSCSNVRDMHMHALDSYACGRTADSKRVYLFIITIYCRRFFLSLLRSWLNGDTVCSRRRAPHCSVTIWHCVIYASVAWRVGSMVVARARAREKSYVQAHWCVHTTKCNRLPFFRYVVILANSATTVARKFDPHFIRIWFAVKQTRWHTHTRAACASSKNRTILCREKKNGAA